MAGCCCWLLLLQMPFWETTESQDCANLPWYGQESKVNPAQVFAELWPLATEAQEGAPFCSKMLRKMLFAGGPKRSAHILQRGSHDGTWHHQLWADSSRDGELLLGAMYAVVNSPLSKISNCFLASEARQVSLSNCGSAISIAIENTV